MAEILSGLETIQEVRKRQDQTLLAMSLGKDAVAAWLATRPHFERVVPVYMYLVPGLEIIQESIDYYERWFGERIIQMPHPGAHRMLNGLVFQAPQNCAVIDQAQLEDITYEDIFRVVREDHDLPADCMYATGVRAADSPMRRIAMKTHGTISANLLKYHPVWDWKKADLLREFRKAKIKLAPDYRYFGRTFDGLDVRFLGPLKKHYPKDYQRVLEYFPLADLDVYRFEQVAA